MVHVAVPRVWWCFGRASLCSGPHPYLMAPFELKNLFPCQGKVERQRPQMQAESEGVDR